VRDILNLLKELPIDKQVLFQIRNKHHISQMKILKKNISLLTLVWMPAEMVLNHLISKRAKLTMFNINQEEELKTKIKGEDLLFMTW